MVPVVFLKTLTKHVNNSIDDTENVVSFFVQELFQSCYQEQGFDPSEDR